MMLNIHIALYLSVFIIFLHTASYANTEEKNIEYLHDPVYESLYDSAKHPLSEISHMAESGNIRAQYILADLYLKGKGGFAPDIEKAKYWFEESAKQKYLHSFIRLAAIAKREDDAIKAYQWYFTGQKYAKKANTKLYNFMKLQMDELAKRAYLNKKDLVLAKKKAKKWRHSIRLKKVESPPKYN